MSDAVLHVRQQLVPVEVPWRIIASTPYLRLTAAESDPSEPSQVTAIAYFMLADDGSEPSSGTLNIVEPPASFEKRGTGGSGPYRLIRITFDSGGWVRMSPAVSDGDVIGEDQYDWGRMAFMQQAPGEGIGDLRRKFVSLWREKSVCPDPGMYEVAKSDWLRATPASKWGFRHFLIAGHDAFVEVLAKGWRWESLDDIKM